MDTGLHRPLRRTSLSTGLPGPYPRTSRVTRLQGLYSGTSRPAGHQRPCPSHLQRPYSVTSHPVGRQGPRPTVGTDVRVCALHRTGEGVVENRSYLGVGKGDGVTRIYGTDKSGQRPTVRTKRAEGFLRVDVGTPGVKGLHQLGPWTRRGVGLSSPYSESGGNVGRSVSATGTGTHPRVPTSDSTTLKADDGGEPHLGTVNGDNLSGLCLRTPTTGGSH